MTEAEWLGYTDPTPMLEFLGSEASGRKLRLFACACCRRIWDLLPGQCSRKAVEISERYADGVASKKELTAARADAAEARSVPVSSSWPPSASRVATLAAQAAWQATERVARVVLRSAAQTAQAAQQVAWWAASGTRAARDEAEDEERSYQSALVRDIFGNPFRPVTLDTAWLTPTVTALARSVYEDRNFADLPILADALEEIGCTSQELLDHLRGPGPHVLGCWALDLVLNKG
jgi:hypothetical protein